MNRVVIKKFIILDHKSKLGNKYFFGENANLITSKENGAGKSCLVKSIYYTLGANVESFPDTWSNKEYIFQVDLKFGKKNITVYRNNKNFKVKVNNMDTISFIDENKFSIYFQDLLDIDTNLTNKQKKKNKPYMNAILLPFYIDQDTSWDELYINNVGSIKMYSKPREEIFQSYLNLNNSYIDSLKEKKVKLNNQLKNKSGEISQINNVISVYNKDKKYTSTIQNFEEYENELNDYIDIVNDLNKKVKKHSNKVSSTRQSLDSKKNDLEELLKLKESSTIRYKEIENKCIYCNSELTREQSLTRLELSDNIFEIILKIEEVNANINELKIKLENEMSDIHKLDIEFEEASKKLNSFKKSKDIDGYIKSKMMQELNYLLSNLEADKIKLHNEIKEMDRQIKEESKKINKDKIIKEYDILLSKISAKLEFKSISNRKFLDFKKIQGSGTKKNKELLAIYLTYSNLLFKNSNTLFPLAIDSFIKNEITKENGKLMFEAIDQYFLNQSNQVIFSVTEENLHYFNNSLYNEIKIENRILKEVDVEEFRKELILN